MGWNEGFLSRRLVAVPDPMGLDEIECFDKPINQRSVIVRAARLHGIGDITVADEPAPTSPAGQILDEVVSAFAAAQRRTGPESACLAVTP